MKKYILIFVLIIIVALAFYFLWGWSGRIADNKENCTLLSAKTELFQKAIDEFGAFTPSDAALLWGKGVKDRNGALQYAVMNDELKKTYKELLDKNSPAWVTGFSSPWVDKYELIEAKKISKEEYEIVLQFELVTSVGSEGKHLVKLSIYYDGKYWVISNVTADDEMLAISGLGYRK